MRPFLVVLGWISVVLGVVALAIPVVPTTPFLLLGAACFARSSPRFYHWLLSHRYFGPPIRNYRDKGGMTRPQKAIALALFWPSILGSAAFAPVRPLARLTLVVCAVGVTAYLLSIKTVDE